MEYLSPNTTFKQFPVKKKPCENFLTKLKKFQESNRNKIMSRRKQEQLKDSSDEEKISFLKISRQQDECEASTESYANMLGQIDITHK